MRFTLRASPERPTVAKAPHLEDNGWMSTGGKPHAQKNRRSRDRVVAPQGQVPGELRVESSGQPIQAKVFVHDVSPSGIGLAVESALKIGSTVSLTVE